MLFSLFVSLFLTATYVFAQRTIQVIVGANGTLTYTPAEITAEPGDNVIFIFTSKNHTVSQSTFAEPCTQFVNTSVADPSLRAVTSGFRPVPVNATVFPTWTIHITEKKPLWFFCAQTGHCSKGMVAAINANKSLPNTFAAFKQKALATITNNTSSSLSASAISTRTSQRSTSTSMTAATTQSNEPSSSHSGAATNVRDLNVNARLVMSGVVGIVGVGIGMGSLI
ncbi:Cupredoxin [Cantharellus anzutake]|uniref:Cupredoxin n=1 Tax=Cantharellus anzutake TaxID=1750568 RepID=UPI001904D794|nr:Cupredoxin [Cantharellus anzutake]KAF8334216.1 Cupredoxin [Cantharellus anzutake]